MRLAGKVALISSGARGMGAAEAAMFCQEGASVVIGDVLDAEGKALEGTISAKGGHIAFVRLDVTREADWKTAVDLAVSRFGKLDVLVNNAGISAELLKWKAIEVAHELSKSPNSKIIVLGDKSGLPIILTDK